MLYNEYCQTVIKMPRRCLYIPERELPNKEAIMDHSTPIKKFCPRCYETKPAVDFRRNASRRDGLAGYCKSCVAAYNRERYKNDKSRQKRSSAKWRKSNKQAIYEQAKSYRLENPEVGRNWVRRMRREHPEKNNAHNAVRSAVRAKRLPRVSDIDCLDCGARAGHYHHESYEEKHWLDVTPLCHKCHKKRHREQSFGGIG